MQCSGGQFLAPFGLQAGSGVFCKGEVGRWELLHLKHFCDIDSGV